MHKNFIRIAAFFGAVSVLLGAFGAHALKSMATENTISIFETGARYQFYHTFALLFAAIIYKDFRGSHLIWSGRFFIAGIILFSFSLYILAALQASGSTRYNWIGAITPVGGICFIAGWLMMFLRLLKNR
jgi:uncharacterized membrane protein YgdD (TMEM256/DUF423 family)